MGARTLAHPLPSLPRPPTFLSLRFVLRVSRARRACAHEVLLSKLYKYLSSRVRMNRPRFLLVLVIAVSFVHVVRSVDKISDDSTGSEVVRAVIAKLRHQNIRQ